MQLNCIDQIASLCVAVKYYVLQNLPHFRSTKQQKKQFRKTPNSRALRMKVQARDYSAAIDYNNCQAVGRMQSGLGRGNFKALGRQQE